MYPYLLAFSAGVIVLHFSSWLPVLSESFLKLLIGLCVISIIAIVFVRDARNREESQRGLPCIVALALTFVVAFAYAVHEVVQVRNAHVVHAQLGSLVSMRGSICSIPRYSEHYVSFDFCADAMPGHAAGKYRVAIASDEFVQNLGACWQLDAKLKPPRSSHNFWQDGYERYLFLQRILGRANARAMEVSECGSARPWMAQLTAWRRMILQYLDSRIGDHQHKGLIYALILGERGFIEPGTSEILKASGTQHLIAISGLHVGLVCWAIYGVLRLLRLSAYAMPVLSATGFMYILLVGFGPSAQRAFIMLLCALYFLLGRAPAKASLAFFLALSVVLLVDPLAPLNPGFWFSFSAVAVLLTLYSFWPRLRKINGLTALLLMQLILTCCLSVVQREFSMPTSVFALFANLVAIPWVSVVVLPLCLIALLVSVVGAESLAQLLFVSAAHVLDALLAFCSLALEIKYEFHLPEGASMLACMLIVLAFALVFGITRHFALVSVLSVCVYLLAEPTSVAERSSRVVVLDAGQGLSIFARSGLRNLVYDTGPAYARYSVAKGSLDSLLKSEQITGLDRLILSHGDADHAGDASWLVSRYKPRQVLAGEVERLSLQDPASQCRQGQSWVEAGLSMAVLWPRPDTEFDSSNNRSCVVMLTISGIRFLLMGDLEGKGERALLDWYGSQRRLAELKADVLVAGHHGARAASSFTLLKHVNPTYVVFSAGYANRFGHPSSEVIRRAERLKVKMLSTAHQGAVNFEVSHAGELRVSLAREQSRAYWVQAPLTF